MSPCRRIHFPSLSAVMIVSLAFLSCKKDTAVSPAKPAPVIYIGGAQNGNAAFWKNGQQTIVPNASLITSITISGADVYMGGYSNIGIYWKNAQPIAIPTANQVGYLAVSGANIYAVGLDKFLHLAFWSNNNETDLSATLPSTSLSYAPTGIALANQDLYITGSVYFIGSPQDTTDIGNRAVYWKNGNLNYLTNAGFGGLYYPSTTGVAISGTDVYISGNIDIDADTMAWCGYWKNGVKTTLLNRHGVDYAAATSIAISGNDVYVSGTHITPDLQAVYWKNGSMQDLPDGLQASAIAISGSDVYVLGVDGAGNTVLWKNSVVIETLGKSTGACLAIQHP